MALAREAGEDDEGSWVPPEMFCWNNMAFVLKTILSFGPKDQHGNALNLTRKGLSSSVVCWQLSCWWHLHF